MSSLLKCEIVKTFLKWRTYIGFIALAVLIPLIQFGLKWEGGGMVTRMTRTLSQDFFIVGNLFNGFFITHFIMNSLWVHVPFLITLVAGDQLAGEAAGGTFRLILTRPPSRTKILLAKLFTTLLYSASLVCFLAVVSLGLGHLLFGGGDLIVAGKTFVVIPSSELWWRMALAFTLAIWSMWCVASLALLFSALVENAIGPIIGTMTVVVMFLLLSNIPTEFFEGIRPYLFTTYFTVWQKAFEVPIPWDLIASDVLALGGFSVVFFAATWYIFSQKDILS